MKVATGLRNRFEKRAPMLEKPPRLRRSRFSMPEAEKQARDLRNDLRKGYVLANDWNIDPSDLVRQFMPE